MKECINCGHESDTPFCPNCGQRMAVDRVTIKGIVNEFFSKWIGFDTQFGRTIVALAIHPSRVIHSYLAGNRTKYIGPLGFLVIMTALVVFSFDLFGIKVEDFLEPSQSSIADMFKNESASAQQKAFEEENLRETNKFIANNYRYVSVALIPFWALSLGLFFRDRKLNYIERFVAISYITCQALWLTMLSLGIFALTGFQLQWQFLLLSLAYYVYAIGTTFPSKKFIFSAAKAIFSWVVGYLFFMIIVLIVFLVIMVKKVIDNPEMFQQG